MEQRQLQTKLLFVKTMSRVSTKLLGTQQKLHSKGYMAQATCRGLAWARHGFDQALLMKGL